MSIILETNGLSRRFGGLLAVDRLDLKIEEGAIWAIIGPNGAGKTTAFNLITGLIAPSAGSVYYAGRDVTGAPMHSLVQAGIVRTFQNIRLFPLMTALENVVTGAHARLSSHPVGAIYDAHHGLTNAVFMPYVLAFNRAAVEDKLARAGAYLGLKNPTGAGFLDWTLALREELKIPHTADALGVGVDKLDRLSAMAAEDPSCGGNPVPVDAAALKRLYERSLAGTV